MATIQAFFEKSSPPQPKSKAADIGEVAAGAAGAAGQAAGGATRAADRTGGQLSRAERFIRAFAEMIPPPPLHDGPGATATAAGISTSAPSSPPTHLSAEAT